MTYLDYYQLTKEPFDITPNPDILFLSPSHREALASISDGVTHRKGFISILGEVGVGKTTILRSYIEQIDKSVFKTIYILYADVSFKELLKTVCQELGVAPETDDLLEMVNHLHLILIDEYKQGHMVVLIIDEAQNMTVETLEHLRMLSNLETSEDKLLQIILIGQLEFEEKLNQWELRQLNQPIVLRARILPFSRRESVQYIQHRLAKAGRQDIALFKKAALNYIMRHARGIPRVINILCGNALVIGFGKQEKAISARTAKEAIADFEGNKKKPILFRLLIAAAALILLAGYIVLISPFKERVLSKFGQMTTSQKPAPGVNQNENVVVPEKVKTAPIKKEIGPPPKERKQKPVKSFPVKRVVKKGDTLYSLVRDVYGIANNELIAQVKQQNKQIKKDNKIAVGDKLSFPEPKKRP
jgi:general secretion pathway protein A